MKSPYYEHAGITIYHGDSRDIVPTLGQFDACVTDPPYELGFMGRKWDASGIAYDVTLWRKVFDALKPGAHLLAFGGTRTYHRMTCAIEDAGFEIRDCIQWVYGSGFPKSLNVAKAIDGAERGEPQGGAKPSSKNHGKFKGGCSEENEAGRGFGAGPGQFMQTSGEKEDRELTEAAKQWDGWGTAVKPANEPIVLARKPLIGTVAANVLAHGTGALNIDGCRVGTESTKRTTLKVMSSKGATGGAFGNQDHEYEVRDEPASFGSEEGRWPANVIHDGSEEVMAGFPQTASGTIDFAKHTDHNERDCYNGGWTGERKGLFGGDSGSAARFFYCAKASKDDRGEGNTHATVKPVTLMRYLCRLVTPPGGRILDPFAGSGTTLVAARLEGFKAAGVDLDQAHADIIRQRICSLGQEVFAL